MLKNAQDQIFRSNQFADKLTVMAAAGGRKISILQRKKKIFPSKNTIQLKRSFFWFG